METFYRLVFFSIGWICGNILSRKLFGIKAAKWHSNITGLIVCGGLYELIFRILK